MSDTRQQQFSKLSLLPNMFNQGAPLQNIMPGGAPRPMLNTMIDARPQPQAPPQVGTQPNLQQMLGQAQQLGQQYGPPAPNPNLMFSNTPGGFAQRHPTASSIIESAVIGAAGAGASPRGILGGMQGLNRLMDLRRQKQQELDAHAGQQLQTGIGIMDWMEGIQGRQNVEARAVAQEGRDVAAETQRETLRPLELTIAEGNSALAGQFNLPSTSRRVDTEGNVLVSAIPSTPTPRLPNIREESDGEKTFLVARRPETGVELWRQEIDANSPPLTENAKIMIGEIYTITGVVPPLGLGSGARVATFNDLAERFTKKGISLEEGAQIIAQGGAGFKAQTASLTQLTQTLDAVTAFEATALANADILLETIQPLIDSGSPLLNRPLRAISERGLGSTELAAFRAARQVALTEISRVISNPRLVGQLSDTARTEVLRLIPEEATIAQINAVVQILKRDMENRRSALQDQIRVRQGSIGGGGIQFEGGGQEDIGSITINPDGSITLPAPGGGL